MIKYYSTIKVLTSSKYNQSCSFCSVLHFVLLYPIFHLNEYPAQVYVEIDQGIDYDILYSSGEQGIDVFSQEAERRNICIALQQKVPSNANNDTYLEVR